MTAAIAGASPRWTARSSMDGLHPSMTASSSRVIARSAQDAQAGVLLVAAATAGDQQRDEEPDRQDRQRREEDARARHDGAGDLAVERQRGGGSAVAGAGEPRPDAGEQRAADDAGQQRGGPARDQAVPPRRVAVVDGGGAQQRAEPDADAARADSPGPA